MDSKTTIQELKEKIKKFCEDRDWDQHHNAKELTVGMIIEVSELLEHFRFKSKEEVDEMFKNEKREEIAGEIADILHFLLRLAQRYNIDLTTELNKKMEENDKKYPIDKIKGKKYRKYTEI